MIFELEWQGVIIAFKKNKNKLTSWFELTFFSKNLSEYGRLELKFNHMFPLSFSVLSVDNLILGEMLVVVSNIVLDVVKIISLSKIH